jgi:GalNAc-alpha-(1->4)-GalNAc-alpha-(1->3)-diNAcBac-PP-undecaprenol alpha-1,4-N-acetyl-D-galactosaminyltransferase
VNAEFTPLRITCVISSLGNGGAERNMVSLCGQFGRAGHRVTLLTLSSSERDFQVVPPGVAREPLDLQSESGSVASALRAFVRRFSVLRSRIVASTPDVVLSFMDQTNVLVLLATRGLRIGTIVAERNNPWMLPLGRIWNLLRRLTYRWADAVTVQANDLRDFFPAALQDRIAIIPNAVSPALQQRSAIAQGGRTVLAAGRLEAQKGFDVLLRAFAVAKNELPGWRLRIAGEGSLRDRLVAQRDALGLTAEDVSLLGRVDCMSDEYLRADIFVLSSRFEGFPNVLCEAMSHGCAVIATRCRSGPSEIVRDGIDGVLVPVDDVASMAASLVALANDPTRRSELSASASTLASRFPTEEIGMRWIALLRRVAQRYR